YNIYRSENLSGPYERINSRLVTVNEYDDYGYDENKILYYHITGVGEDGDESKWENMMIVETSEERKVFFCRDLIDKTGVMAPLVCRDELYGDKNQYGEDLEFQLVRRENKEVGRMVRVYDIEVYRAGSGEQLKDFRFRGGNSQLSINYLGRNGEIRGKGAGAVSIETADIKNRLGMFFYNGKEWIKIGGDVRQAEGTISIKTKYVGRYGVKESIRAADFTITNVYPKIITPNGDGKNDTANLVFDNPKDSLISCKIYDIAGRELADLKPGWNENVIKWDGRDNDGNTVSSGVYIYQFEVEGKAYNGTIVVAR
ncbi:MAG: gliding motility-associated C-terminal domain-containing protein, partial [Elusimicrobiota bacterium]